MKSGWDVLAAARPKQGARRAAGAKHVGPPSTLHVQQSPPHRETTKMGCWQDKALCTEVGALLKQSNDNKTHLSTWHVPEELPFTPLEQKGLVM